jgi:hypothetical protein
MARCAKPGRLHCTALHCTSHCTGQYIWPDILTIVRCLCYTAPATVHCTALHCTANCTARLSPWPSHGHVTTSIGHPTPPGLTPCHPDPTPYLACVAPWPRASMGHCARAPLGHPLGPPLAPSGPLSPTRPLDPLAAGPWARALGPPDPSPWAHPSLTLAHPGPPWPSPRALTLALTLGLNLALPWPPPQATLSGTGPARPRPSGPCPALRAQPGPQGPAQPSGPKPALRARPGSLGPGHGQPPRGRAQEAPALRRPPPPPRRTPPPAPPPPTSPRSPSIPENKQYQLILATHGQMDWIGLDCTATIAKSLFRNLSLAGPRVLSGC